MKIIYVNCGVKNYMKVDHHSYRRNFCSCENNNNNNNNNNNDNNNYYYNNNYNNNNNNKKKKKKKKKKSTLAVWFLGGVQSFRYNSLHNEIHTLQRSKVVSPHHEVELMPKKCRFSAY